MKQTISVLVENQAGVLNRITGLWTSPSVLLRNNRIFRSIPAHFTAASSFIAI